MTESSKLQGNYNARPTTGMADKQGPAGSVGGLPPSTDEPGRGCMGIVKTHHGTHLKAKPCAQSEGETVVKKSVVKFEDVEAEDLKSLEAGGLAPLFEGGREAGGLNPVVSEDGWGKFPEPLVIDSGASATVLPDRWFNNHRLRESEGSKSGEFWRAANNSKIFNLGERTLQLFSLDGGIKRSMTFQVAQVGKALGSVSKIVHSNDRIVFDPAGSYIESVTDGLCCR